MGNRELTFDELSTKAKTGFNKFSRLAVKDMRAIGKEFTRATKLNPNDVTRKEEFGKFVDKKIRKKR